MSNRGMLTGVQRDGGPVPVEVVTPTLTILFAKSGSTTYFGWAVPGSLTSSPVWKILRLIKDTSSIWADGNKDFDNVWDDHTGLVYP